MEDCVFCSIKNGKLPSFKIYEDEFVYAFLDIANDVFGHTLVIPKKHFESVLDCDENYLSHVMTTIKKISKHFIEDCGFEGVNILNASGKSAEQSVFHLHFHILPRKANDGHKVFPSLSGNDKSLESVCDKLRMQ